VDTVAVIGSNSFSGQDFVDLLLAERPVRVLGISRSPEKSRLFLSYKDRSDLSRFAFHRLDLNRDYEALFALLDAEKPAYVVNFASQSEVAPSWEFPEQWFETNAVAIARLGNFLKEKKWLRRYVHISTPEVYGTCDYPVGEDAPFSPSTPYAASRAAGELMLQTLVKSFNFPLVVIRSSNVYGAHQQLWKIIPRTAIYVRQGRKLQLHGGGRQVRSFIHIRDVSRGELAAMEHGRTGEAYNLAPERGLELRDVVAMVCECAGADFADAVEAAGTRTGHDASYELDASKARSELGWEPEVRLEDGVAEVVEWVAREWSAIEHEPLEYVHKP
jgi:dTDP-glucose 4,6-dehydratase